ncbi:MAG: isoprenylcysteine carboxylmethyltransferase family protein [Myxococcales bacterium]|nr:isoprenylcysteine carboxylmethyltransferase family protein [Myxococcales bacterium]
MADRRAEGRLIWLRATGLLIWAMLIGYFVSPASMAWTRVSAPPWLSWVGAGLAFVSVVGVAWVLHHLGPNLHRGATPLPHHTLVTTGPYRFIRHPWFAVLILLLLALSFLWSSWPMFAFALVRTVYFSVRARIEERALRDAFGAAYDDYARNVPRFLPFLPFGRGAAGSATGSGA